MTPSADPGRRASHARLLRMIVARIGVAVMTLFLVSLIIFVITNLLPGDAAQELLGQTATPAQIAALRHEMGLDRPAPVRFGLWLAGLAGGDAGMSMVTNMPVSAVIAERLPNSLLLAAIAALVSVPFALSAGILSAVNRGGRIDSALNLATLSMVAVPEFLVATIAVLIFSVELRWLPSISMLPPDATLLDRLQSLAMPVASLSFVVVAQMARMTRAAIIDQLDRPYVEMARLKGLSARRIVIGHVLPNALGPIVNAMALSLSYLLGGAIIVETIFNYPGIAKLMVDGVSQRDMPLVQTCAMLFCTAYLFLVTTADVCGILANPRLRHR